MPIIAVIPIKSFTAGKGRLADVLDAGTRADLGLGLADHTLRMVEEADLLPVVVTDDGAVADWAGSLGVPAVADPGTGLSDAATAGVEWALTARSPWIVIHADLPLLRPGDLDPVVAASEAGGQPVSPSSDGGTSILGSDGRFDFSYGKASFHRHLIRLEEPVVITKLGLMHDLDTARDLQSALAHPLGAWLQPLLG